MGIADLRGVVDFVLAYAMVHEMPSAEVFFSEVFAALRPGGRVLLAEPAGHVGPERFERELAAAQTAGLRIAGRLPTGRSLSAVLSKP
jgi:SAM-dependent methyltransferase